MRAAARFGLAATVLLQSCSAGWRRTPLADADLAPRQQAQVWAGGRAHQWHAVVVTADSVSGIPFVQPPGCDSCRVALPRSAVDSLRVGNPVRGFSNSMLLIIGVPFMVLFIYCSQGYCTNA